MISKIVRASAAGCHVDKPTKSKLRMVKSFGTVGRMQIEDCASIWLFSPRQETLSVTLYKAYSAINQLNAILAEIFSHLVEKSLQFRSRDINLSNNFGRRIWSMQLAVYFAMVIVGVNTQLVDI